MTSFLLATTLPGEAADRRVDMAAPGLGVPIKFRGSEAKAGRVPHLKIGRQYRFNLEAVERELAARADALNASARESGNAA